MSTNYSHFLFTRWTKGETVEKSSRFQKNNHDSQQEKNDNIDDDINNYNESKVFDDLSNGFTRQVNKRDSFNQMLSNRDLHTQVGQNPFLAGESYLQHLKIQEDFLRPQNTNIIEPKTNS